MVVFSSLHRAFFTNLSFVRRNISSAVGATPPSSSAVGFTPQTITSQPSRPAVLNVIKQPLESSSTSIHTSPLYPMEDSASFSSNYPREDRDFFYDMSHKGFTLVGVIDGHSGHRAAETVKVELPLRVMESLESNLSGIESVLTSAYIDTDKSLLKRADKDRSWAGQGACTLTAVITDKSIIVANAGDCGALLISEDSDPRWLNNFHNAANPIEKERLLRDHPNEDDAVECIPTRRAIDSPFAEGGTMNYVCYTKGLLQPTRALGDFYLKEKRFAPHNVHNFNPPYLTGEPEIVSINRDKSQKFLVLATDGLWELFSAKEVQRMVLESAESGDQAIAQVLVDKALTKVANEHQMRIEHLKHKPDEASARDLVDDLTISVVRLS